MTYSVKPNIATSVECNGGINYTFCILAAGGKIYRLSQSVKIHNFLSCSSFSFLVWCSTNSNEWPWRTFACFLHTQKKKQGFTIQRIKSYFLLLIWNILWPITHVYCVIYRRKTIRGWWFILFFSSVSSLFFRTFSICQTKNSPFFTDLSGRLIIKIVLFYIFLVLFDNKWQDYGCQCLPACYSKNNLPTCHFNY